MKHSKQFSRYRLIFLFLILPLLSIAQADDIFSQSSQELAIDAMKYSSKTENWIFSPISAAACLSMIYAGSDGNTAAELKEALHLNVEPSLVGKSYNSILHELIHRPASSHDYKLNILQGLWSEENFTFLDEYISSMQTDFEAQIDSLHFSPLEVERINEWISDKTEKKIQTLLNPEDIDSSTKLVLANTIYFSGEWVHSFKNRPIIEGLFYLPSGDTLNLLFMSQNQSYLYYEDSDCQAVILPFQKHYSAQSEPVCMLILPAANQTDFCLTMEKIEQIFNSSNQCQVSFQIPKFSFEQEFDLQGLLQQLHVSDAFSPLANFSKMNGRLDLYLSKVVQKCFFSFDEEGVVAAAATGAAMNMSCCAPSDEERKIFVANRPFEYLLFDQKSRTCLMIGHIASPQ